MKGLVVAVFAAVLPLVAAERSSGQCTWGSFDAGRVNYAGGVLTTGSYGTLRSLIAGEGGTLAPATPMLTASYLAGVDVFFTSLLNNSTGALSPAEQAALVAWVEGGGTLVVTGDISPLAAYDSFTAPFGVTGYTAISTVATGAPVPPVHPITASVGTYRYVGNCTFSFGSDAQRLGDDSAGNPFLVVLEPSTGFEDGGRVVVTGDHSLFTDATITANDNAVLAANLVAWACGAGSAVCPSGAPGWSNYGAGVTGTNGVPALAPAGLPLVGQPLGLVIGNSLGAPTTAFLLLGGAPASLPTSLGGVLLVQPIPTLVFPLPIGPAGLLLPAVVPADPTLCGVSLYLQVVEFDPGAPLGASFSRGLAMTFG